MKISNKIGLFFFSITVLLIVIIITLSIMYTDAKKAELIQKERFKFYELVVKHKQNTDFFTDVFITYVNTNDYKYRKIINDILEKEKYSDKNIKKYRNEILKKFNYDITSNIDDAKIAELKIFIETIDVPSDKLNKIFKVETLTKKLLYLEFEAINAIRGVYKDKNGLYTIKDEANESIAQELIISNECKELRKDINTSIDYLFSEIDIYLLKYLDKLKEEEDLAYKFIIFVSFILLSVVFSTYFNFKKSIIIPLEKLAFWIEQMQTNKFVVKERSFQNDEIGMVMNSFINMADTIQKDIKELESLSTTDILTKLNNRVTLDKVLEEAHYNVNRYNTEYSIILIDIDHFKDVNDEFGHIIGDIVLREFAGVLKKDVRKSDTLGRWGGEEFLIICANTNSHRASKLAEKLRENIENFEFTKVNKKTASFGITSFNTYQSVVDVLDNADKALYKAKNQGRNQVVVAVK